MNYRALASSVLLALLPLAGAHAGGASETTDRLIVKWRSVEPDARAPYGERVDALARRLGRRMNRGRDIGGGMSVVRLAEAQSGADLSATMASLRADPDVELVEPDRRVRALAYTPNDPLFTAFVQYNGTIYGRQWYLRSFQPAAIRASDAWDITRGGASAQTSPVVVAVIDSGVRASHPDLAGKLLPGYDFVSVAAVANDGDQWDADPSDPGDFLTAADLASPTFKDGKCGSGENHDQPTDSTWHGTRVSALLAADTDNGEGIAGAGFNIRVLPVRALGKCGGFESDVIAGMYWAAGLAIPPPLILDASLPVNQHPAKVINLSLGSEGACSATYTAAVRDLTAQGVLVVASAGNEGTSIGSPANCAGVLAVTGLRHAGTKVGYSNLGPEAGIGAPAGNCVYINLNEPCVFALDTASNSGLQGPEADTYTTALVRPTYGTSFSAPLVSATAGLMTSVNPALTPTLLISRLKASARAFPTVSDTTPQPPACVAPSITPTQATECICTTQVCGAGMLDAAAAVSDALRPAAIAAVSGPVRPGSRISLVGASSAASVGRTLVSYQWSLLSGTTAGAVLESPTLPTASLIVPSSGQVVVRLVVTDNQGATDQAEISVEAGNTTSTSPPTTGVTRGGGFDPLLVVMAALFLCIRRRRSWICCRP